MRRFMLYCIAIGIGLGSMANAATFRFDTDPFAGSTALTTPGRQIVAGEAFINFSIASDVFSLDPTVFGVPGPVHFVNDVAANIPTGGVNVIVLETFDNDNNPATPFAAGNAANLIASQITTPGAGFFIYFNQALDTARLVFSTNLDDNNADLKVLFRMTNLSGQAGRDALPSFTAANFELTTPEPSNLCTMTGVGLIGLSCLLVRRRRKA